MPILGLVLVLVLVDSVIAATNITSCQQITSSGDYTLNQSINISSYAACLDVTSNDVSIDCQGFTIGGNVEGERAIFMNGTTNLTVQNCLLDNYRYSLDAWDGSGLHYNNVTITNTGSGAAFAMSARFKNTTTVVGDDFTFDRRFGCWEFTSNNDRCQNMSFTNFESGGIYLGMNSGTNPAGNITFDNFNSSGTFLAISLTPINNQLYVKNGAFTICTNLSMSECTGNAVNMYSGFFENISVSGGQTDCWADVDNAAYTNISANHCGLVGIHIAGDHINLDKVFVKNVSNENSIQIDNTANNITINDFEINITIEDTAIYNFGTNTTLTNGLIYGNQTPGDTNFGGQIGMRLHTQDGHDKSRDVIINNVTFEFLDIGLFTFGQDNVNVTNIYGNDTFYLSYNTGGSFGEYNGVHVLNGHSAIFVGEESTYNYSTQNNTYQNIHGVNTYITNAYLVYVDEVVSFSPDPTQKNNVFKNITGDDMITGFRMEGDHNEIDCQGGIVFQDLYGSTTYGATLEGSDYWNLSNCHFDNYSVGVFLNDAQNNNRNRIENITITHPSLTAILASRADFENIFKGILITNVTAQNIDGFDFTRTTTIGWINDTVINTTGHGIDLQAANTGGASDLWIYNISIYSSNGSAITAETSTSARSNNNDDIFLDCAGGTLRGNDVSGITALWIDQADNWEVENCTIRNFDTGIYISSLGTGATFENNYLCENTLDAQDDDTNTWTGNQCNSTVGNANCTSVPVLCPSTEPPTPPVNPLTCIHPDRPYRLENTPFYCGITNASNTVYACLGVTRNPSDNSLLSSMPEWEIVKNSGASGGYKSHPRGEPNQSVQVHFSSDRLKADTNTNYLVRCLSNETTPTLLEYSVNLTPQNPPFYPAPETALSLKNNLQYVIGGILLIMLIILLGAGLRKL